MDVNTDDKCLTPSMQDEFHSVVAKLLYLEKRSRPDLEPTIAFLSTRVQLPGIDDWKKLRQVLTFLKNAKTTFGSSVVII